MVDSLSVSKESLGSNSVSLLKYPQSMGILDVIILLLTGLVAIYMIFRFVQRQKNEQTAGIWNIYYIVGFLVLLVAGLLLIIFGWEALGHDFVAVVAGLIPFSLATGLMAQFYPKYDKLYLGLMVIGLVLIALARYADMEALGKIAYPLFHAIAGLTIVAVPFLACKGDKVQKGFGMVAIGGILIGLGGMALAFLKQGTVLLFFTNDVVFAILSPLLLLMSLFFTWGFMKGVKK